jgi:hypothetical protein
MLAKVFAVRQSSSFATCLAACLAVALAGCFDRGGLDNDDGGLSRTGGTTGTGGSQGSTGGSGNMTGTGGQMTGSGGQVGATGGRIGMTGTGGRAMTGSGGRGTGGATQCGAMCAIACQYGYEVGPDNCPLCKCKPKPTCDAIACPALCPYGFVTDANGCPTCTCNPPPMCQPVMCDIACPYGFMKDEKGCEICRCNPGTCTPEECGTPPPSTSTGLVAPCPLASDETGPAPGGSGAAPPADDRLVPAPIPQPICQRNTDGKCVWVNPRCGTVCPAIACTLACPNGFLYDTRGCQICACNPPPPPPPPTCASFIDYMTCQSNMQCQWLQPGCGEPALAAGGCYDRTSVNCTSDAQCGMGHQCLKRVINPCFMQRCAACGQTLAVCQ